MNLIRTLWIAAACLSAAVLSCTRRPSTDHPGYIDSAFRQKHLLLGDSGTKEAASEAFHTLNQRGPLDRYDYHWALANYYHYRTKDFHHSLLLADSMLADIRGLERAERVRYVNALFLKGDALMLLEEYPRAFQSYYAASELIPKSDDGCDLSQYHSRLANVAFKQERYREAARYFVATLRDFQGCDKLDSFTRFASIQGNMDNAGIAYLRAEMPDSAAFYFEQALSLVKSSGVRFPGRQAFMEIAEGIISGNYSDALLAKGDTAQAEKKLLQSISMNSKPAHDTEDLLTAYYKIVRLDIARGRPREAQVYFDALDRLIHAAKNPGTRRHYYEVKAELAVSLNRPEAAYATMNTLRRFEDSIRQFAPSLPNQSLLSEFDDIRRSNELRREDETKNIYLIVTAVLSLAAITIVILVYSNYRQSRRNITSLQKLNKESQSRNERLVEALEALEQSHQNNTRLLKVVAHDLRGPVGSITQLARMMDEEVIPPDQHKDSLKLIVRSGTNSLSLINDLLRMDGAGQPRHFHPVDICEILEYCGEMIRHNTPKKVRITYDCRKTMVRGDREELWRVFSNILNNAVKFSHEDSVVRVTVSYTDTTAVVQVRDQGVGMPAAMLEHIFEHSGKVSRQGTSGESSFGLGLFICKQIVERHAGRIWVTSTEGEGTSVFTELPLAVMA